MSSQGLAGGTGFPRHPNAFCSATLYGFKVNHIEIFDIFLILFFNELLI